MSIINGLNVRRAVPSGALALAAAAAVTAGPLATAWLAPAPVLADDAAEDPRDLSTWAWYGTDLVFRRDGTDDYYYTRHWPAQFREGSLYMPELGLMHTDPSTGQSVTLREGQDFVVRGWTLEYDDVSGSLGEILAAPAGPGVWFAVMDGRGAYAGTFVTSYAVVDLNDISTYALRDGQVALEVGGKAQPPAALKLAVEDIHTLAYAYAREGDAFDVVADLGRGADLNGRAVERYRLRGKGWWRGETVVEVPVDATLAYDPDDWWEAVWARGSEPTVSPDGRAFSGTGGLTLVDRDLTAGTETRLEPGRDFEVTGWALYSPGGVSHSRTVGWLGAPDCPEKWFMRCTPVAGGRLEGERTLVVQVVEGEVANPAPPAPLPVADGWSMGADGAWAYLRDGLPVPNLWVGHGGHWYRTDATGRMVAGWALVDGSWYWFYPNGIMATGWQAVNGAWYYLDPSGSMATGWRSLGGAWYYLQPSGAMATGWQLVNGTWYYFHPSGAMAASEWVGGYWCDASGAWVG